MPRVRNLLNLGSIDYPDLLEESTKQDVEHEVSEALARQMIGRGHAHAVAVDPPPQATRARVTRPDPAPERAASESGTQAVAEDVLLESADAPQDGTPAAPARAKSRSSFAR